MASEIIEVQTTDGPTADGIETGTSLLLPTSITSGRFAHFPEDVYDLSAESHLVRFLKALIGDSGAGQLRKRFTTARLQQTIQGAHFYDLDRFYGALFGVRRTPDEVLLIDPYQGNATADEWSVQTARDASYRSRVTQLARALQYGPTPTGMELAAEALLSVDCDVYESYIEADGSALTYGEMEGLYGDGWIPTAPTTSATSTNLFTNPTFATVGSTYSYRANFSADPAATGTTLAAGTGRWQNTGWGNAGAGTVSSVTNANDSPLAQNLSYMHKVWTTTSADNFVSGFLHTSGASTTGTDTGGISVTASAVYTASAYVRTTAPGKQVQMVAYWRTSAGAYISLSAGAVVVPNINEWTRISVTGTAPVTGAYLCLSTEVLAPGNWTSGQTLDGTGLLIEKSSIVDTFFSSTVAGPVVRSNRAMTPNFENGALTGWVSRAADTAIPTTISHSGTRSLWVQTWGGSVGQGIEQNYDYIVRQGDTGPETISAWIKGDVGAVLEVGVDEVTGGNTIVRSKVSSYNITLTSDWQRVVLTASKASPQTALRLYAISTTTAIVNFYLDDVLIESGSTLRDYFDGSTSVAGHATSWIGSGGSNISSSVMVDSDFIVGGSGTAALMMAQAVIGVTSPSSGSAILSKRWSDATQTLRIISNTTSAAPTVGAVAVSGFTPTSGTTYTAVARLHIKSAVASSNANARTIFVSGGSNAIATQAPAAAGTYEIRLTWTAGSGETLYLGGPGAVGEVWWSTLTIVAGTYTGPPFFGFSSNTGSETYAWTGTPNGSTSTRVKVTSTNLPGNGTYAGLEGQTYSTLEGSGLSQMSGDSRRYFTVRPKRTITASEAYELGRVLDRIKPVDARFVIDYSGSDPYVEVEPRSAAADSEYWEIIAKVSTRINDTKASPYQVNSTTPTEQPRPAFSGYQGEAWSYVSDVIGVAAYYGEPEKLALPQIAVQADGTEQKFPAVYAVTPRRYVLAGRAASDGIMVSNPAWGAASTVPNSTLSPLLVDGMTLDTLNQYLALSPLDSLPQNPDNRFWPTAERYKTDATSERLAISLTQTRMVNYLSVEVARYPHTLTIEYWDGNDWVAIASRDTFDSSPQFIPPGRVVAGHPQHNFPGHWARQAFRFPPVMTNSIRLTMVRLASGVAPRSDASTEIAYSLAARSLDIGYRISSLEDVPAPALDGSTPIGTSVDLLGSPIEYYLRTEPAANAITDIEARWICEPQPVNYAVVNYFLDVRDTDGDAQVLDRFFMHPTHPGANMSIYTTEALPPYEDSVVRTYTNIALNPRMDASAGTVITRLNMAPNPRAAVDLSNINVTWPGGGAPPFIDRVTSFAGTTNAPAIGGETWVQASVPHATAINGTTPISIQWTGSANTAALVYNGRTYSISAYVNSNLAITDVHLRIVWMNEDGPTGEPDYIGPNLLSAPLGGKRWVRISDQVDVPVSSNHAQIFLLVDGVPESATSATVGFTGLLVETRTIDSAKVVGPGTYFDGTYSPDSDLTPFQVSATNTYAWLTGALVTGVVAGVGTDRTKVFQSGQWNSTSPKSLRILAMQTASDEFTVNDTYAEISSMLAPISNVVGQTITVMAKVRLTAPQTGVLMPTARTMTMSVNTPLGGMTLTPKAMTTPPNKAGAWDFRATFEIPATATSWASVRLYNGASLDGGDVWWDDLAIVPGAYTGDYFDGAAGDHGDGTVDAWVGSPNASMSTRTVSPEHHPLDEDWLAQQVWRPINRDYRLQKGYVYIPPTAARFVKFEFTSLTPEQIETFLPIEHEVRLFPQYLVDAMVDQTAGVEALPSGVTTAMNIGDGQAYADALMTLALQTYDPTTYDPVEALYASNPALAARLRDVSWVYGFTPWHQGSNAPRFGKTQVHDYRIVNLVQTNKVGFFVGLYEVKAFRADVGANDDTMLYDEPFHDFRNLQDGFTWTFNPHALTTDIVGTPRVVQSAVYSSLHNVDSVQFATTQTEAVQVIPDDDLRDPALASIDWYSNPSGWHQVGDSVVVYSPQNHSARVARYSTPLLTPSARSKSLVQPTIHPVFGTRAATWSMPYPPTQGGIESPDIGVSGAREVYLAVRLAFITEATSPVYAQLLRASDSAIIKEFPITAVPGQMVERFFKVDPTGAIGVKVRLVQKGVSDDVFEVDRLSLFDVGITWEFSVNGGDDWIKVGGGVRNNANGILTFPEAGNQLTWRATGYRSFMALNAVRVRPHYVGIHNARDNGEQRGANVSAFDAAVSITEDPLFNTWSSPIPRDWFLAYRRLPSLVSATGPSDTEFARFYGRPIDDGVVAPVDSVARMVIAKRSTLDFARGGDMSDAYSASDAVVRVLFLKRAASESVPEPVEALVVFQPQDSGHSIVNRLPHLP